MKLQEQSGSLLALAVEIYQKGAEAGVASVPAGEGGFSQAQVDQFVSDAVAAKVLEKDLEKQAALDAQKADLKEKAKAVISDDASALDSLFA